MAQTIDHERYARGGRSISGSLTFTAGAATVTLSTSGIRRVRAGYFCPVHATAMGAHTTVHYQFLHDLSNGVINATGCELTVWRSNTNAASANVVYQLNGW